MTAMRGPACATFGTPWSHVRCAVPPMTISGSNAIAGGANRSSWRERGAMACRVASTSWQARHMAGYSGTPLPQKLGIKDGSKVALVNAPTGFADVLGVGGKDRAPLDVIVLFVTRRAELERQLGSCRGKMQPDAGLWIAWPKKASKVPTDITEQTIRDVALPTGLVDNKVCAIDETWSGLRLVIRKELRAAPTKPTKRARR